MNQAPRTFGRNALGLVAAVVALGSLLMPEANLGVAPVRAQPPMRMMATTYPSPTTLAECRANPTRFGVLRDTPARRRRGRPRANERFYLAYFQTNIAQLRVATSDRSVQVTEAESLCAFIISIKFLYASYSERCIDDFVAAYGSPYRFYTYFRSGFSTSAAGERRFYLQIPEGQSHWGIGLSSSEHEPTDGLPHFGRRDPSCPTAMELDLVTGTPRLVPTVPPVVVR
jgi:hypothetical protein